MTTKQITDNFVNTAVDTIQTAYIAPTDKNVIIESMSIANNSGVDASYKVYIVSDGGATYPIIPYKIAVWGRVGVGIGVVNQAIPAGGALKVESSALASIYFTTTGREITL